MKANLSFLLLFSLFFAPLSGEETEKAEAPFPENLPVLVPAPAPQPTLADLPQVPASPEEIAAASLFKRSKKEAPDTAVEGYTINYSTVSILEYIRFAGKICKVNFIYDEADLNFTVTVVSDEPITPQNVMATLLQVLRIHGLQLLEQGNNLVIHKASDVKQIATIVTEGGKPSSAPIVTRIFRIKNAKPDSIAAIVRPMISTAAILETSPETRQLILTDITANVDKVAALIENLDSPHTLLDIKSFEAKHNSPEYLIGIAGQIMAPIASGNPFILVPQTMANSIFIVSTPELVEKTIGVLNDLDSPPKKDIAAAIKLKSENISFFIYRPQNRSAQEVQKAIVEMADNIKGTHGAPDSLIDTISSVKINPSTQTLIFSGEEKDFPRIQELLAAIDASNGRGGRLGKNTFYLYKIEYASENDITASLKDFAKTLDRSNVADEGLSDAIANMKYIKETRSLLFTGHEAALKRLQEIVPSFDKGIVQPAASSQFFVYKPVYQRGDQLVNSVKEMTAQLKADQLADPAFLNTLETMKWVKSTNSLLFTGDAESIRKTETLIGKIDMPNAKPSGLEKNFFLYQPQYANREKVESYLRQIGDNLHKKHEDDLVEAIRSAKWIESSHSFMFHGTENSLNRLKELLTSFDTADIQPTPKPAYYLYKVQNTTGDVIEDDLDRVAKGLKSSGVDQSLVETIEKMRYVKETNSLLLTGNPQTLEEAKKLIADYDYPRAETPTTPQHSSFFMYKPQHLQAAQIQKSLQDVGANLKKADLADPPVLSSIDSAKYVETTNSLIFTGTPDALQKIQGLISEIDVPAAIHAPIQHVGKTTFLLYKLKNAGGPQIVSSLKTVTADLKKSGTPDKDFLSALNSMKYVKETNSLFFTGTEESLGKVQALVDKFDVTGLGPNKTDARGTASDFFVYKTQSLTGPDLEKIMEDFAENLKQSGLADPDLFNAVSSMRWIEKTQSLVFTGTPKALDQVKELLKTFDIPSNLPGGGLPTGPLEPSIQAIDNTSFLVYKLQFHKGDEIQGALRQIAKDLTLSNAPVNQNLLNSINSIQWLEVTNSLLCSGDQETLTRLRELIKNLDIPLKQVYIEMLVIQTSLTNALNFGLEWSGNYKYRNKFAGVINNTPTPATGNYNADPLFSSLQNTLIPPTSTTSATAPTPQMIPASGSGGFDLGIIGEVIRHNGQTFLSLASLLQAIQQDSETSIVLTPKILTQDGRTSSIFVGSNIPFVGSFVQNTANNATINTSNLEYRDIGLNLTITPVLGNSDIVTLDISLDQSQTIGTITGATIDFTNQTANGIVTSKTTMETTVHVPDNNFLILSGMVNSSDTKQKNAIPCLGGLPLIGAAFSKSDDTLSNSNLVIFIRPHIINSLEDMRSITSKEEEFFRDQTGTPFLERNYNEAMELIKTIDDE